MERKNLNSSKHKVPIKRACTGACAFESYTKLSTSFQVFLLLFNASQENQVQIKRRVTLQTLAVCLGGCPSETTQKVRKALGYSKDSKTATA